MHRAATGEWLLTAVKNHHNNLTVSRDTNAGTGVTLRVIRAGSACRYIFTVANKPLRPCGCLPDSAFAVFIDIVSEILRIVYDCRLAIFENSEEVIIAARTERYAINESDTHRLTGGHVVEGRVYARNNIIVLADEVLIVRVGVFLICVRNLIGELVHTHNTVFVLFEVGGLDEYIVACDVSSSYIVNHLLAVFCIGVINILLYAGSKC